MPRPKKIYLAVLATALLAPPAHAATKYYVGPTSGASADWNNTTNWSLTLNGAGGAPLPTTGDAVSIVTTSDQAARLVTYDYSTPAVALASVTIDLTTTATDTLYLPSSNLTVTGNEYLGFAGNGKILQTGGTNTVATNLYLGNAASATGTYLFSGTASQLNVLANEYVGFGGKGTFTQSSGLNTVAGIFSIAQNTTTSSGSYALTGGTLAVGASVLAPAFADNEYVGFIGAGIFNQTGGTNTVGTPDAAQDLYISYSAGASGTYYLNNPTASLAVTGDEIVGNSGSANFLQSSGTHNIVGTLYIAANSTSAASFVLAGGSLTANSETVGFGGTAVFIQNAGTNTIGTLGFTAQLIVGRNGIGSYSLTDPSALLTLFGNETIGSGTSGTLSGTTVTQYGGSFIQTAGTHNITASLILASAAGSSGFFSLSGGTLSTSTFASPNNAPTYIGQAGIGLLVQSGGTINIGSATIPENLFLGYATGAQGTLTINNSSATLVVNGNAYLGGTTTAAAGAGIINLSSGALAVTGTLKIWPTANTVLNLNGGSLYVGALDPSALPHIAWTAGSLNFLNSTSVGTGDPLGTTLLLTSNQTLSVSGALTVDTTGSFVLNGGSLTAASLTNPGANPLIFNSGTADVSTLSAAAMSLTMPLTLTNTNSFTITNALYLNTGASLSLTNTTGSIASLHITAPGVTLTESAPNFTIGTILLTSGSTLSIPAATLLTATEVDINPTAANVGSILNLTGGQLTTTTLTISNLSSLVITNGTLSLNPNATFTNNGQLTLGSATNAFLSLGASPLINNGILTGSGQITGTNALLNQSTATLSLAPADRLTFNSYLTNAGKINLAGTLQIQALYNATGTLTLNAGTLLTTAPLPGTSPNTGILNAANATLSGHGSLQGPYPLDNFGKIQLSGGNSDIYSPLTNEATGTIAITGNATATFYSPLTLKAGSTLTVNANSTAVFFANVTGTATISGPGTLDFEAGHSATPALANLGTLTVGGLATLTAPSTQVTNLIITGSLTLGPTATGNPKTLNTASTLTLNTNSSLDLTNTDLLLHNTSATTLQTYLTTNQLHSSSTTATTTLAYLTGTDYLSLHSGGGAGGGVALFDNTTVLPTDLLIKFTYLGDATLDGQISVADYAQLDAAFLLHLPASWLHGDFNHDGQINYLDYALIDAAYRAQSGPLANTLISQHAAQFGPTYLTALNTATTPTPEPTTLPLLALSALILHRRKPHRITPPT